MSQFPGRHPDLEGYLFQDLQGVLAEGLRY